MKNCSKHRIPLRHVIFTIQVISLIISVFHKTMPQPIAMITYCIGVFTTPFLILSYGKGKAVFSGAGSGEITVLPFE